MITSSVEVCNIAKDVYTSVKNEEDDKHIEDIYLESTSKITY